METSIPAVITIHIGVDTPQPVLDAVMSLVQVLGNSDETAAALANYGVVDEECVYQENFRQFFEDDGVSRTSATGFAERAMSQLLRDTPDKLIVVCRKCNRIRGVCRCPDRGHLSAARRSMTERWFYYDSTKYWKVTLSSLLALTADDLCRVSNQARPRLLAYIAARSNP